MTAAAPAVLEGRVVVVTGGSTGIGFHCAQAVVRAGGRVMIAARGETELERARSALAALGGNAVVRAHVCDVASAHAVDSLFAAAQYEWGHLWGVVHAAAVIGPIGAASMVDPEAWWSALRTNLFGSFLVARAAGAALRAAAGGRIVLFSGGGATSPFPNYSAYGCSKAAVVRLAETLAHELAADDILVNAVAPGFVATRMHEETLAAGERAGAAYLEKTRRELAAGGVSPELAASAVLFLLSDDAAGITGRLLAAPWDDWRQWPLHRDAIADSDLFTLRRIVPRDRGHAW